MEKFVLRMLVAIAFWAASAASADTVYQHGEFKFSVAPAPSFVLPRDVPSAWDAHAPGLSGERWRYWLHDEQIDRRPGQNIVYEEHVYEPVSPELVTEAGKFTIEFNPLYQTLALHRVQVRRDGVWLDRLVPESISLARRETDFENDMSDGMVSALIVLNDIRAGDLIRIAYSITGSNPVLAGNIEDRAALAWNDPVLDYYFRVLYPAKAQVNLHLEQGAPAPEQRRGAQALEVLEHVHGVDAIHTEDDYPLWFQPYPTIQVAQKRSWADIVAWAEPLYPTNPTLPPELEARIAEWAKIADPYRRAMAALTTVQEEVRYFGVEMGDNTHRPTPPADTWNRRFGDCKDKAYLLASILRRLGYDADPALVSIKRGRGIADFTPAASVFDHVITRVKIDGSYFWLDATATQQRGDPRTVNTAVYGMALPIAAGVTGLQAVVAPKDSLGSREVSERFQPAADGKTIELVIETRLRGEPADQMRRQILSAGVERLSRGFSDFYRKRYGDLDVVGTLASHDDATADVLQLTEHYRLKEGWAAADASTRALEVYAEGLSTGATLPSSMSRNGPLALVGPASFSHEIRIELPDGWDWSGKDSNEHEDNPAFRYTSQVSRDGRSVVLQQHLDVTQDYVAVAQLPEYFRQMRKVNDDMGLRVYIEPSTELRRSDRDQRLRDLLKGAMQSSGGGSP